jgi:putative membrane protein
LVELAAAAVVTVGAPTSRLERGARDDGGVSSSNWSSNVAKAATDSRTRDELANERTFLAWLRTAVNVMIVGLAIARFGAGGEVTPESLLAGLLLIAVGAGGVVYGSIRYRQTSRDLDHGLAFSTARTRGPVIASVVLVAAIALALVMLLAQGDIT